MIVGFFGSREGCSHSQLKQTFQFVLNKYKDITVVVGDCIGVDKQIYDYCKMHKIPVKVIAVHNNWAKISYRPLPEDVLFYVDSDQPLRVRLAQRTIALVHYVHSNGGVLVGINVDGKGSQLAISTAQRLGVPCYTF